MDGFRADEEGGEYNRAVAQRFVLVGGEHKGGDGVSHTEGTVNGRGLLGDLDHLDP